MVTIESLDGGTDLTDQALHVTWTAMSSTRDRVRQHRERLRRQGLRPVQIWVPDVRAPEFVAEAHRQSVAIATSEGEADDQAFVDAMSVALDAEDEQAPPA